MTIPHASRRVLGFAMSLLIVLVLSTALFPAPAPAQYATVLVPGRHEVFCTSTRLVLWSSVVPAGRCFKLAALRNGSGTYLAFLQPQAPIDPGQILGFDPPGPSGIFSPFLLVPVNESAALPLNTMALVPARFETWGRQTRVVLMGGPLASTIVAVPQAIEPVPPAAVPPAVTVTPPVEGAGNVVVTNEGQVFCPSANLLSGTVVIPQGDCYRLAVLRNFSGTFLAFIPEAIALPSSRIIALSGPAMGAVSRRAYLVPISTHAEIQMNSVVMVPARISVMGGQEVIVLTGGPAANSVVRLGRRR
jgi:hypothetical protein